MYEQLEVPLGFPPRRGISLLNASSQGLQSIITWPLESITWLKMTRTMIYGMVLFTITSIRFRMELQVEISTVSRTVPTVC